MSTDSRRLDRNEGVMQEFGETLCQKARFSDEIPVGGGPVRQGPVAD
jgi:hypothetical protein